jgi:hypothetical protein
MKRPELDPIATLRELRDYLALSYEANDRIAPRIGITVVTLNGFLSGKHAPQAKTTAKSELFYARRLSEQSSAGRLIAIGKLRLR